MSKDQKSGPSDNIGDLPGTTEPQGALPDNERRRFTRAAGMAVPVIMTLSSRPVWARNCSDSAVMSGNLSTIDDFGECGGEGCSADMWASASSSRWGTHHGPDRMFADVFGHDAYPGKTLLEVVTGVSPAQTNPPAACTPANDCETEMVLLGREVVAALENAAADVSFDMTVDDVLVFFDNVYLSAGTPADISNATGMLEILNTQGCPFI